MTSEAALREPTGLPPCFWSGAPPLALWRTTPPHAFTPEAVDALDRLLGSAAPRDAASAVAAALRLVRADGLATGDADAAMSRLIVLARQGDATAPVVLAHALATLARRRPDACCLHDLANQWARRSRMTPLRTVPSPGP